MTTIAGLEHNGKVWMAGDSLISFGKGRVGISRDPKVWVRGEIVFGAAGDVRGLQLTKYTLKVPKLPRSQKQEALLTWLVKDLAGALRECWSTDGEWKRGSGKDGTDLIIGVRGSLFYVDWDLSFTWPNDGVAAIGSAGAAIALASLRSNTNLRRPKQRLTRALDLAVADTNDTRPPFVYVHT